MTDEKPITALDRISIGFSAIQWFVLVIAALIGLPVLLAWSPWLLVAAAAIALLVAFLVALAVFVIRRLSQPHRPRRSLPALFLKFTAAALLIVIAALAFPVYYFSYKVTADPLIVPQVTLTDGRKTVVFQGMVHIGTEQFYKSVVYDLEEALVDGYRLYYEGVMPSPGEGDRWFAEHFASGGDLNTNYQNLAGACGVVFQGGYFTLLSDDAKRNPERHVQADVTKLEMKQEYERLVQTDPDFAARMASRPRLDPSDRQFLKRFVAWQNQGTRGQRLVGGVICRGVLKMSVTQDSRTANPMSPVMLDFRNRKLVERILADPADKIYITYGSAHLPGVIALLKQKDRAWRVVSLKWIRGLAAPEHLEGNL